MRWILIAFLVLGVVFKSETSKADMKADQYWTDIEKLCMEYSGATHPPCNRSNGAKMILDSVQHDCSGDASCLKKAVAICLQYSGATHPACNASNGLKMTLEVIQSYEADQPKTPGKTVRVPKDAIDIEKGEVAPKKAKTMYADQYWTDIEKLCMKYSGATHPPCNRSNGAGMILDSIQHDCNGNKVCLRKAVAICVKYSGATHPACNESNGLKFTLNTIKGYEAEEPKAQTPISVPANAIDIKTGEGRAVR